MNDLIIKIMRLSNTKQLFFAFPIAVLVSLGSCETDYDSLFEFAAVHPSGFRVYDGSIKLVSGNQELIDSIEWYRREYSSNDLDPDSLRSGDYKYTLYFEDQEIKGVVRLSSLDTVSSVSEYLPAYPGSWWQYSNGDSIQVSEKQELVSLYDYYADGFGWHHQGYYRDDVYVSRIKGLGALWNNNREWPYGICCVVNTGEWTDVYPLKEESGQEYGLYQGSFDGFIKTGRSDPRYTDVTIVHETSQVDTIITVPAGTFHINLKNKVTIWNYGHGDLYGAYQQYLSEGTGLILLEKWNEKYNYEFVPAMELESYHVARE